MSTHTSRAVRIDEHGGPDKLKLVDVTVGEPGPGEIRIRHKAVGLNYIDVYQRAGLYPLPMPLQMGMEASGVIEAVGEGVTHLKVGDRAAYASQPPGSYCELRVMPAKCVCKLPDAISFETGAAMMLKGLTAQYLLKKTQPQSGLKAGDFVLFHAAAGGVGLIACQWAKALGLQLIGTAGSDAKCALALANGASHAINYATEDFVARVKEITGGAGVPVVFDSVGKDSFEASLNSLAPRGYFVSFGTTTGAPPPVVAGTLQKMGSLYFTRPTLVTYTASTEDLRNSAVAVFDMFKRGALKVSIKQRYKMQDVAQAHTDLAGGKTSGSSIILPS